MDDRQRIQADLEWLIKSPDFLSATKVNSLYNLDLLDASELLREAVIESDDFVFEPTHRLGVYFEQLWHHLIRSNKGVKLLRNNAQVIINKQTLGEFDSIIQILWSQQILHCELAVKFYLQIGDGKKMADWVGPNLKDRFDRKFNRLLNHQLALSTKSEVKRWLQREELTVDHAVVLTRGRLFYAIDNYLHQNFDSPQEVSQNHLKGFWMTHQEFNSYLAQSDYDWYQLPRMHWLSELTSNDLQHVNRVDQLRESQLVKVVAMKEGKEVMRGFVVTDEWLDRAKQRVLTKE